MNFRKIFLLTLSCFALAGCDFGSITKTIGDEEQEETDYSNDNEGVFYTVNFYGYENILIDSQQVQEGKKPIFPDYREEVLLSDSTLIFTGWSNNFINGVYQDTEVFAEFVVKYTVTFYDNNNKVFDSIFAFKGETVPNIPGPSSYVDPYDPMSEYRFDYWEYKTGVLNGFVIGNVSAYPVFQKIQTRFYVQFVNDNGDPLFAAYTDRNGKIVYDGPTPTKASTKEGYYYEFVGWSEDLNHISADVIVRPVFEEKKHQNGYKVNNMTEYDAGTAFLRNAFALEAYEYDFACNLVLKKEVVFDGKNIKINKRRFILIKRSYQETLSAYNWLDNSKGEIENRYLMSQKNIVFENCYYYCPTETPIYEYLTYFVTDGQYYYKYEKPFGLETFIKTKVDVTLSTFNGIDDLCTFSDCLKILGSYPTINYNETGEFYYLNTSDFSRRIYFNNLKTAYKLEGIFTKDNSKYFVGYVSPFTGEKITTPEYDNSLLLDRLEKSFKECVSFMNLETGENYSFTPTGEEANFNKITNPGTVVMPKHYRTMTEDNTEIFYELSSADMCMFLKWDPTVLTFDESQEYYRNYSITEDENNVYFKTNFPIGGKLINYEIYIGSVTYSFTHFTFKEPVHCFFEFTDL